MITKFKISIIQFFKRYSLPRWLVFIIDISTVFVTFIFAYLLRFNFETYTFQWLTAIYQAFMVTLVYSVFMLVFKSYSGLIRQTTVKDTFVLAVTNSVSFTIAVLITLSCRHFLLPEILNVPLSIIMIHYGTVTVSLIFFRVFIKMFYVFVSVPNSKKKNVLIYGSGETGIIVKRMIEGDPKIGYHLYGFIDDNSKLQGKKLDGYPVYSKCILSPEFIEAEDIKVFILAIKAISVERKKEILESAIELGLEILDTPSFDQWLNGKLQFKQLRKVQLEDLLGREPISLDLKRIGEGLCNKTILVTGAAGSIGSEIVRQLTKFNYKKLVLVEQAETPSFFLNNELSDKYPNVKFDLIIGDVTNLEKMELVFRKYLPDVVFHAAAYKHVPLMEDNPHEAFRVNVGGTMILSDLAIKYNAGKFVMISTDKAVNPTNVMGATKKVSEILVQAQARRAGVTTRFVTTRFGNVLGSNGSVIPLFKKQIAEGGPVTITHPDITRFFMTIPEACQLVLEAGFMGNGGEIFIFDMGKPVKILDVAKKLILLSGLEPYKDIEIKYSGLRPGEKLFEELFADAEQQLPTHNPKITIARVADADYECILPKIRDTLKNIYLMPGTEVVESMKGIVPGYSSKFAVPL